LAVALTVIALILAAAALGFPVTVAVLGAIVAMQASLAITDPDPKTTTLLALIPGLIGITLGAVFASAGVIADLVFLVVLFTAVAIRSRGLRFTAFGTIAMMTYFFALFLSATPDQLPALWGAVAAGIAFTYTVRFLLLPDRPVWLAQRTIDAFKARLRQVAQAARELIEAHDGIPARRRLAGAVSLLNETAASIEGRLGGGAEREVRLVFDAELAAEDLAAEALAMRDAALDLPRGLRLALLALTAGRADRAARVAGHVADDTKLHPAARGLAAAIVELRDAVRLVDAATGTLARTGGPWYGDSGAQQPVLRQAIQVTAASAVAIAVGEQLSPQRWYWAVLATYFVFVGTASSGETFSRAWSRIGGTALGVAAGILVGHLGGGRPLSDTAALFVCLFLGVYFLRISQMIMIFFVTAMLALLYSALGRFSDGLLGIRLIETAVGALCGGIAATVILPTRTRDVIRASAAAALDALHGVVHASIARLLNAPNETTPLDAVRALEERVQRFTSRTKPAVAVPALVGRGHELRRWIVSLSACSYYARLLARTADRSEPASDSNVAALFFQLDEIIEANIRSARDRIDGRDDARTADTRPLIDAVRGALDRDDDEARTLLAAAHLLERLDRAVARLARDEGTVTEIA
jgi:uncharacterized membrane protein YccC